MSLTDRRAQQILRPYGGWMLTDILIDPDAGISSAKGSFYGATGYVVGGARCWMQTRAKGIELGQEDPRELLPWTQVKRIATAVPAELRDRLIEHRLRGRLHQADYPRFVAHGEAVGCGRTHGMGPLTRRQALHAEQYKAWEGSGVYDQWLVARAALLAEEGRLHDEALPLSVADAEPTDLLELLAVGAR